VKHGGVPVAFVKYYEKGSTVMGADQVSERLRARGWDARSIPVCEIGTVRDGVLIFIKTSRLDHLLLAKARGNRLALDVQDTVVFKRRIKNRWLFDALIFKNLRQLADFGRKGRHDRVIYHQWDPRYSPNQAPRDRMVLGYLGSVRSLPPGWRLPAEAEFVEFDDREPERVFQGAPRFNAHLAVRQPGRELLYKPNCKVSTAAACEAVLISTRDATTVELLGEDYPFYCDLDPESVQAAIRKARDSFGSAEWNLALERLRAVRELTRFDRILDQYEDLIRELVPARRSAP
jgi:hypothetical protein